MSVDCNSCEAACCRAGIEMVFWPEDVSFMIEAGTSLKPGNPAKRSGAVAAFVLQKDCALLTGDGECSAYEEPNRPKICQAFKAGSAECLRIRDAYGVPLPPDVFVLDLSGDTGKIAASLDDRLEAAA